MERLRRFIHAHTPSGRIEEYLSMHAEAREQARGRERYDLEITLERDAKRYANGKMMQDTLFLLGVALGGYAGFRIARDGWDSVLTDSLKAVRRVHGSVVDIADAAGRAYDAFLVRTGSRLADGAGISLRTHAQGILEDVQASAAGIGSQAAEGALASVHAHMPDLTIALQSTARSVGATVAETFRVKMIESMPEIIEAAGISFELAGLNRLFPKKGAGGK